MKNKNIWTRLLPGSVQRSIVKSWVPFGDGHSETMMGQGAPVWIKQTQNALLEQGFGMNPSVYMVVSYITRLAAQIPWVLYEVKDEKQLTRYKNIDPLDTIKARILEKKALEDIGEHKILDIIKRPNSLQGQSEFIEQLLGYKLITGGSYVYGSGPETGPNMGQYHELEVLPSQLIGIKYGGPTQPVAYYYWSMDPNRRIDPDKVMHVKFWNYKPISQGGLYGLSPLQSASRIITRDNDGLTASVKSLQNMGAVGILSRPTGATDQELTTDQAQEVEDKYVKKFGGPTNRGKVLITGATLQWQQMGMSPVDLEISAQDINNLRKLCGVYGLQSQLFNDPGNKTYNNMKEAKQAAYTQAAIPNLRSIRDELNRWWVPAFQKDNQKLWLDLDLQAVPELQTDIKNLMEWLKDAEMLTLNEKRQVIEYEALEAPGMDSVFIDGGKLTPEQAAMDPGPLGI